MREGWRRRPDLNRGWRFCRPLPYHLATAPCWEMVAPKEPTDPTSYLEWWSCLEAATTAYDQEGVSVHSSSPHTQEGAAVTELAAKRQCSGGRQAGGRGPRRFKIGA